MGAKLERYLNQLAEGKITKEQFEGYVLDMRELSKMQAVKMNVSARARVRAFEKGMTALVINGLLVLL